MAVKLLLGLLVVLFIITFAGQNPQSADIFYFFGLEYNTRVWMVALAPLGVGMALMAILFGFYLFKEKGRNWMLLRKVDKLEEEVKELKQRPLPDLPGVYPSLHEKQSLAPPKEATRALPESHTA